MAATQPESANTEPKPANPNNRMLREFFLGFVNVHVLHHASQGPIYGASFLARLAGHDYHLSPGTLYPLLHNLESTGYLKRDDRVVEGKVRKYYTITPLGRVALDEARQKIRELVDEVSDSETDTVNA